jgi:hypothetical protein
MSRARIQRTDLGLAISGATLAPGKTRTLDEIAAYCDVTKEAVRAMEVRALQKLRKRLVYHRDPILTELCAALLSS